ncbi:hypothetical protein MON38_07170 [Hymenobacter sp. DH14]|uniref:General stress protein 17M-like domain-containing protein n=1 Tax=Hymenobacter cyanobacteriorum TaxID=2926463 RepID=A0A9X1VEG3_9BACT|nr:hypothetical protein [Hymenobacter cyanobacteriorum]MCI1187197.1 hypothetical protein [Hymenobacter cyanobacteriorum]
MARTVVGLFTSVSEAEFAVAQLQAAGFAGPAVQLATRETLQAQHLPGLEAPTETFQDGVVRFFSNIFSGTQLDDAAAHIAATGPEHAVITVDTTTAAEADQARELLDRNGAIDVYKQRPLAAATPTPDANEIDLEGDLGRVRDDEELDANGLTTH